MWSALQALMSESGPAWLRQLLDEGDAGKTMSELLAQGAGYMATVMQSLWSGGKALASFISVLVIMPVVTFYLICDWHEMVATLDGWVPPRNRATVHRLVGEIDAAISGFLRGQAGVCLIVGIYYAVALSLIGLNFGLLIGVAAGVLTFMPYIGSMAGLLIAVDAWRSGNSGRNGPRSRTWSGFSWSGSSSRATCWLPSWWATMSACTRSG